MTQARLPAELFGDYSLVEHPATKDPWMMPVDLLGDEIWEMRLQATTDPDMTAKEGTEGRIEEKNDDADRGDVESKEEQAENFEEKKNAPHPTQRRGKLAPLPRLRITNHPAVLSRIAQGKSPHVTRSLIPYRWKHPQGFLTKKENDTVVWREDLPDYVLRHLRKNVVRGMKNSCVAGKDHRWSVLDIDSTPNVTEGLVNALVSLGDLKNIKCGAVLLLKQLTEKEPERNPVVPETITLPLHGTRVPILNLPCILSEKDLQELREHHDFFSKDAVLFRPSGDKTVYTMLGLWSLNSYVTS